MTLKKHCLQWLSLLFLLCAFSCKNEKPLTTNPTQDSTASAPINSKRLFVDSIPQPTGYVNDYEGIFTAVEKDELDSMMAAFEKETSIEMAVVTFDSTMTTADGLEKLTLKVANVWGVGKKNKDNGILVGLTKHHRKIRIENGIGIAKILSDAETKAAIDEEFIPLFKQGNYFDGTRRGLLSLMQKLRRKYMA